LKTVYTIGLTIGFGSGQRAGCVCKDQGAKMHVLLLFDFASLFLSTSIIVQASTAVSTYRQHAIRHHHSHHRTIHFGNYSSYSSLRS